MRSHTRDGMCPGDGGRWWEMGGDGGGVERGMMLGQGGWRMSCNRAGIRCDGVAERVRREG